MSDDSDGQLKPKASPHLDNILNSLKEEVSTNEEESKTSNVGPFGGQKSMKIEERIRRQKIDNDNKENDQTLKQDTLKKLFRFLSLETIVVFVLAFLQGFRWWGFSLEQWSFRIVIGATIGQITAMLIIAVQHLFPRKAH